MPVTINAERVWDSLMDMAQIGATPKGGVNRIAFSELDRAARDLFRRWANEAGCTVRVDRFGNMFARRAGSDPSAPVVMAGSHLDSQPTGGKFDGTLGVLGALEVIRALNDADIKTTHPIEIVNWTNEEGCLFQPMIGSAVWTGLLDLNEALAMREDREGWSIAEGLAKIGYDGSAALMGAETVACYLELHIEQGPVLEQAGESIGVVDATQGQHWYDLTLLGQEAHAGPTPMTARRDALMGMSEIARAVDDLARSEPPGCGTIGRVDVFPNSPNTIPGRVSFSCDLRHPDAKKLSGMDRRFRDHAEQIAADRDLTLDLAERVYIPPMPFNAPLADAVEAAAIKLGKPWRRMYTGAGHDACNVARHLPTAMIFIPCRDGISHNEAEHAEPEHVAAGVQVLATTILAAANGEIGLNERS
ncbi:MAG: Zn-dependent hydrolase [Pseudomonadota bacterium]